MHTIDEPDDTAGDTVGAIEAAVRASLDALTPDERDTATRGVALRYARLMDEAALPSLLAKSVQELTPFIPNDKESQVNWRRIVFALAEHSVTSDLGPKLQSALDSLLLTPRSRQALVGKSDVPTPGKSKLDELAARRRGKSAS